MKDLQQNEAASAATNDGQAATAGASKADDMPGTGTFTYPETRQGWQSQPPPTAQHKDDDPQHPYSSSISSSSSTSGSTKQTSKASGLHTHPDQASAWRPGFASNLQTTVPGDAVDIPRPGSVGKRGQTGFSVAAMAAASLTSHNIAEAAAIAAQQIRPESDEHASFAGTPVDRYLSQNHNPTTPSASYETPSVTLAQITDSATADTETPVARVSGTAARAAAMEAKLTAAAAAAAEAAASAAAAAASAAAPKPTANSSTAAPMPKQALFQRVDVLLPPPTPSKSTTLPLTTRRALARLLTACGLLVPGLDSAPLAGAGGHSTSNRLSEFLPEAIEALQQAEAGRSIDPALRVANLRGALRLSRQVGLGL